MKQDDVYDWVYNEEYGEVDDEVMIRYMMRWMVRWMRRWLMKQDEVYACLSYDVASESEITPCNKICKPLVVYRFSGNFMTSIQM